MVWGVAGHEPTGSWPVYRDVPASQQLDLVNAIGATYYRSTSSTALLNLIQGNSAYANIRILPVLGTGFSNTDFQQNPNGYTNAVFYSNAKQHAIDWVNSYSAYNPFPFDCVEIANELDNVCILSGRSGSSPNDYDSVIFGRIESAVQGLCDGVRAANPTVLRAFGCAGWLHYGFLDRLITDLGAPDWEKVVYHWYSNMGLISSHSDVTSKLQGYATTYNTPTWITETDCVNGSDPLTGETTAQAERRHAGAMEDLVQDMKQFSFIHVICTYELIDEPNNGATEAHYGIYRAAKVNNVYTITGAKPDVLSAYRAGWSIDDGATYELEPRHAAGMRLDVAGGSGLNGANVDIFTDASSSAQRWQSTYMGNAWFEFAPLCAPTMRLDVNGAGTANGTNVKSSTQNDTNAQLWFPNSNADGSFSLAPQCATASRLDVSGSGTTNSTNVDIWTATGGANQSWTLYNYSTRQFEAESLLVLATSGDTHRLVADVNMSATQGAMFDSNAVNDYVAYVVPNVAAGSYDVRVRVKKFNTRGIVQLSVGRVDTYDTTHSNVGAAQDMYSSTATYPEIDLGTWTPGTTSDKEFRFIVTGKNAASSGYTISIDYIKLIPQ